MTAPAFTAAGVIQSNFGIGKKQGNLQVFPTKFGRSRGNAQICIGSQEALQPLRVSLLKSSWFIDALPGHPSPASSKLEAIFQPDGKTILPPISESSKEGDIRSMLKLVHRKLGTAGHAAMKQYFQRCAINLDSEIGKLLSSIFGPLPDPIMGSSKPSGRKRKEE
jgi:hypothetical protein